MSFSESVSLLLAFAGLLFAVCQDRQQAKRAASQERRQARSTRILATGHELMGRYPGLYSYAYDQNDHLRGIRGHCQGATAATST